MQEFDNTHINGPYYVKIISGTKSRTLPTEILKYSIRLSKLLRKGRPRTHNLQMKKTETFCRITNHHSPCRKPCGNGSLRRSSTGIENAELAGFFFFFFKFGPESIHCLDAAD